MSLSYADATRRSTRSGRVPAPSPLRSAVKRQQDVLRADQARTQAANQAALRRQAKREAKAATAAAIAASLLVPPVIPPVIPPVAPPMIPLVLSPSTGLPPFVPAVLPPFLPPVTPDEEAEDFLTRFMGHYSLPQLGSPAIYANHWQPQPKDPANIFELPLFLESSTYGNKI